MIHSCSYYCELPACIKSQRDFLRDLAEKNAAPQAQTAASMVGVSRALLVKLLDEWALIDEKYDAFDSVMAEIELLTAAAPQVSPSVASSEIPKGADEPAVAAPYDELLGQKYAGEPIDRLHGVAETPTPRTDAPHYQAAFINAIAEEGTKQEAIAWLQQIWNERCQLERELAAAVKRIADKHKTNLRWIERVDQAETALAEAQAEIARLREDAGYTANGKKRSDVCVWVQDSDGPWNSSCGQTWEFIDGGPEENNAHFCHKCGGALLPEPYAAIDAARSKP